MTLTFDLRFSLEIPAMPRIDWGRIGRRARAVASMLAEGLYKIRHALMLGAFACGLASFAAFQESTFQRDFAFEAPPCHTTSCAVMIARVERESLL